MTKMGRNDDTVGAWMPWTIAMAVPRLRLRPASQWSVLLAILLTWCRYGRKQARLSIDDIVETTGLSRRTVQAAVAALIKAGLVRRAGRYKALVIDEKVLLHTSSAQSPTGILAEGTPAEGTTGGADKLAPRKRIQACASPNSIYVSKYRSTGSSVFTAKQTAAIQTAIVDVSELLGHDATILQLPQHYLTQLGFPDGTTYATAMSEIASKGTTAAAGKFTGAVLALRHDERVLGRDLAT